MKQQARSFSTEIKQIDLDVNRTFRNHIMFMDRFGVKWVLGLFYLNAVLLMLQLHYTSHAQAFPCLVFYWVWPLALRQPQTHTRILTHACTQNQTGGFLLSVTLAFLSVHKAPQEMAFTQKCAKTSSVHLKHIACVWTYVQRWINMSVRRWIWVEKSKILSVKVSTTVTKSLFLALCIVFPP